MCNRGDSILYHGGLLNQSLYSTKLMHSIVVHQNLTFDSRQICLKFLIIFCLYDFVNLRQICRDFSVLPSKNKVAYENKLL